VRDGPPQRGRHCSLTVCAVGAPTRGGRRTVESAGI
jgi:hypothetical protein